MNCGNSCGSGRRRRRSGGGGSRRLGSSGLCRSGLCASLWLGRFLGRGGLWRRGGGCSGRCSGGSGVLLIVGLELVESLNAKAGHLLARNAIKLNHALRRRCARRSVVTAIGGSLWCRRLRDSGGSLWRRGAAGGGSGFGVLEWAASALQASRRLRFPVAWDRRSVLLLLRRAARVSEGAAMIVATLRRAPLFALDPVALCSGTVSIGAFTPLHRGV